jgi:cation diffusion facilitator CzcD-associated flavoprotein CzcO
MFADQEELKRYTNGIIDKYGLREKTELNANVRDVRWNQERQRWVVTTDQAGTFEGQILINASGPLSTPVIPDFPGRDTFRGRAFHTNNWDHSYDYRGKRVAVIGSGASAAQVIPALAEDVRVMHVFQRTPHWVMPRPDHRFSALERKLLSLPPLYKALRWLIYWTLEIRVVGFKYSPGILYVLGQRAALRHLKRQVPDPKLRALLTPDYTIGCKRIVLSSTLYPALCRDNVTLHAKDDGIAAITPSGIRTQKGEDIELDLIVWATGYDATDGVISYPVIGRDGRSLGEFWKEYPRAYLGTSVPGFPNFFVITGPNTGIGHTSALFIIESQLEYIMNAIKRLDASGTQSVEVQAIAEADYTNMIHKEMERTVWKSGGCRSWYQSKSGHVIAMFPGFSFTYRVLTRRFRPEHHVFA